MKRLFLSLIVLISFIATGQENPNFYLHENGVTCMCTNAKAGDKGVINNITYTRRTKSQINPTNAPTTCTSGIKDMSNLFMSKASIKGDISHWDVSKVTNMDNMFFGATNFNQPLNAWCVENITSEPINFSTSSALTEENKPIWGSCKTLSTNTFDWMNNNTNVYPNPFTADLTINLPENVIVQQAQVVNAVGQTVYTSVKTKLNVEQLPNGIYFLKINTNQGDITKKIIKH